MRISMNLMTLRTRYKRKILAIASLCHAENVRIFGSVARQEETDESDIDFLVHMQPDAGFSLGGLQWRLEELLKHKVDVVPDTSLHHLFREKILKEAVPL
jgi:predicted nucleotidyltransferase